MKIKTILRQYRRDFNAVYECEHCDHQHEGSGYDDTNFHQYVVPNMECPQCGKKVASSYRALAPKHADSEVV